MSCYLRSFPLQNPPFSRALLPLVEPPAANWKQCHAFGSLFNLSAIAKQTWCQRLKEQLCVCRHLSGNLPLQFRPCFYFLGPISSPKRVGRKTRSNTWTPHSKVFKGKKNPRMEPVRHHVVQVVLPQKTTDVYWFVGYEPSIWFTMMLCGHAEKSNRTPHPTPGIPAIASDLQFHLLARHILYWYVEYLADLAVQCFSPSSKTQMNLYWNLYVDGWTDPSAKDRHRLVGIAVQGSKLFLTRQAGGQANIQAIYA